jgi:hypothetical protein
MRGGIMGTRGLDVYGANIGRDHAAVPPAGAILEICCFFMAVMRRDAFPPVNLVVITAANSP